MREGGNKLIIMPYARKLVHYFGSPLFIDGTFTSDKKTIIHVCAVSSTNTIILLGLVLTQSENVEAVSFLLKNVVGEERVCIISDEGQAMKSGIAALGSNCQHMYCVWHLAKQMPVSLVSRGITLNGQETKDLLYTAARGTAFTFDMFVEAMSNAPDLLSKLTRIRTQWCRRFTNGMRRDFISTASEAINGAVKRIALDRSQIRLCKAFVNHSQRAYQECCEEVARIPEKPLMPLAYRYIELDKEVAQSLTFSINNNGFDVYFNTDVIAHVSKNERGLLECNCGQDIGTLCPHILAIADIKPEDYTHPVWFVSTFKAAFNEPSMPISETIQPIQTQLGTNQARIISAVRTAGTISNKTTEAIIELIRKDK